jgi:hypothetical protein
MDLEKYHELSVFRTLFSLLTDIHLIFGTLLCHTKIHIKFEFEFFSKSYGLWTQKNITNYQFSRHYFSLLTDIHLIFGTMLCHTKTQIKFEFGFHSLILGVHNKASNLAVKNELGKIPLLVKIFQLASNYLFRLEKLFKSKDDSNFVLKNAFCEDTKLANENKKCWQGTIKQLQKKLNINF